MGLSWQEMGWVGLRAIPSYRPGSSLMRSMDLLNVTIYCPLQSRLLCFRLDHTALEPTGPYFPFPS